MDSRNNVAMFLSNQSKRMPGVQRPRTGYMDVKTEKRLSAIENFIWHGKIDNTFIRSKPIS